VYGNPDSISAGLFNANYNALAEGIESQLGAIEYGKPNAAFLHQFKQNAGVFAAFKTHKEQSELVKQLLDNKGNLRSFAEFTKATTGIVKDYNRNYLTAEYNMAVRSARMAEKWQTFEKDKDLYPNLEYMPSRAANPREDHEAYYHIILPIDHKFWNTRTPPIDWGCLCGIRNTNKAPTAIPEDLPELQGPFAINPGKDAKFVDDTHPYYEGVTDIYKSPVYKWLTKMLAPIEAKIIQKNKGLQGVFNIGKFVFSISTRNLKALTTKPHSNRLLRNLLIIDLKQHLNEAKFMLTKTDQKNREIVWHYYSLDFKGETFYLNFKELPDGRIALHAIMDTFRND